MKRLDAIQKSTRTMIRAWSRSPSHCLSARTSSVSGPSFRACSHCSNWSSTMSSFVPGGITVPRRTSVSASASVISGAIPGQALLSRARSRGSRSLVATS